MNIDDTLKMIDRLIAILRAHRDPTLSRMIEYRDEMSLRPMSEILEAVPGDTVRERARNCGVSTATYYAWLRGKFIPRLEQAKRISSLTGYSIAEIRGSTPAATALAALATPLVSKGDSNNLTV